MRQLIFCLVSRPDHCLPEGLNAWLISALDRSTNPLITWELGALLQERAKWDRSLSRLLQDKLRAAFSHRDNVDFWRYGQILLRDENLLDDPQLRAAYRNRAHQLAASISELFRGDAHSLFLERLALCLAVSNEPTCVVGLTEQYAERFERGDFARYLVSLSLPSLTARYISREQQLMVSLSLTRRTITIPFLAQPFLYVLWNAIASNGNAALVGEALHFILGDLWKSDRARADDWFRFIYVSMMGLRGPALGAPLDQPTWTAMITLLNDVVEDSSERLFIRAVAHNSRRLLQKQ